MYRIHVQPPRERFDVLSAATVFHSIDLGLDICASDTFDKQMSASKSCYVFVLVYKREFLSCYDDNNLYVLAFYSMPVTSSLSVPFT